LSSIINRSHKKQISGFCFPQEIPNFPVRRQTPSQGNTPEETLVAPSKETRNTPVSSQRQPFDAALRESGTKTAVSQPQAAANERKPPKPSDARKSWKTEGPRAVPKPPVKFVHRQARPVTYTPKEAADAASKQTLARASDDRQQPTPKGSEVPVEGTKYGEVVG